MSKLNSPHFLGCSGFAEEITLGKKDLREQFDFATELPVVHQESDSPAAARMNASHVSVADSSSLCSKKMRRDFSQLYWRLRGPNQWPSPRSLPGFRNALQAYHDAIEELSYDFVHLVEEAFGIPTGTFDHFFGKDTVNDIQGASDNVKFLPPQHRIKLLRYPPATEDETDGQGVGAHKESSGWLTFLYQTEHGLPWDPIPGSFVVNFGNAFDAATEGAVKATIYRVLAPRPHGNVRYSIPFFQGLPVDMSVSEVRRYIPEGVRRLRRQSAGRVKDETQSFLDPRWDSLGESQLRKWIRSHKDVALKWYGEDAVAWYTASD